MYMYWHSLIWEFLASKRTILEGNSQKNTRPKAQTEGLAWPSVWPRGPTTIAGVSTADHSCHDTWRSFKGGLHPWVQVDWPWLPIKGHQRQGLARGTTLVMDPSSAAGSDGLSSPLRQGLTYRSSSLQGLMSWGDLRYKVWWAEESIAAGSDGLNSIMSSACSWGH